MFGSTSTESAASCTILAIAPLIPESRFLVSTKKTTSLGRSPTLRHQLHPCYCATGDTHIDPTRVHQLIDGALGTMGGKVFSRVSLLF